MRGKRGQSTLYFLVIELFLASIVILSLFAFVGKVKDDTQFVKTYYSRDIAFSMLSLYAAPGTVKLESPKMTDERFKLSKFSIDLTNRNVEVTEKGVEKPIPKTYPYGTAPELTVKTGRISQAPIIMFKDSEKVGLGSPEKTYTCQTRKTLNREEYAVFVHPDATDKAFTKLVNIGKRLSPDLLLEDAKETIEQKLEKIKDSGKPVILVSISSGKENSVTISSSSIKKPDSARLGCLILNELKGQSLSYIQPALVKDARNILAAPNTVGVHVTIANVDEAKTADMIKSALDRYFKRSRKEELELQETKRLIKVLSEKITQRELLNLAKVAYPATIDVILIPEKLQLLDSTELVPFWMFLLQSPKEESRNVAMDKIALQWKNAAPMLLEKLDKSTNPFEVASIISLFTKENDIKIVPYLISLQQTRYTEPIIQESLEKSMQTFTDRRLQEVKIQ